MPRIIPSLFKLVGDGFVNDAYAANGNHLRWQFDPRLGFPRFAFCLERRPAVGTKPGFKGIKFEGADFRFSDDVGSQQRAQFLQPLFLARHASKRPHDVRPQGTVLNDDPFVIDFSKGSNSPAEPYVCYVDLTFSVTIPGGRLQIDGLYTNRGEDEVVVRESRDFRPRRLNPKRLKPELFKQFSNKISDVNKLLETMKRPPQDTIPPRRLRGEARKLFQILSAHDRSRFRRAHAKFFTETAKIIEEMGLRVDNLVPDVGFVERVDLAIRADRIDKVAITGRNTMLSHIGFVHTESVMNTRDWQRVGCYPIITHAPNYVERNQKELNGDLADIGRRRMTNPMPRGVEPLDVPLVPPPRPPTPVEYFRRYLLPYLEKLEPWIKQVLETTEDGSLHQSEVTIQASLDEVGQAEGDGISPEAAALLQDQTMTLNPYGLLLSAAGSFPVARLLGLGAIDMPNETGQRVWDYRVRGIWQSQDVAAWGQRLLRDAARLAEAAAAAPLAEQARLQAELLEKYFEISQTSLFLQMILAGAQQSGLIELYALKMGVEMTEHALFDRPTNVAIEQAGLAIPDGNPIPNAVAEVSWPLRERARVIINEEVPIGACVARRKLPAGSPEFDTLLNGTDPDSGVHIAVIPVDEDGDRSAALFDNAVEDSVAYRYGVSESDIFNRWSRFTERNFTWTYDVPPIAPAQVSAELAHPNINNPALTLDVTFRWPRELAARPHTFFVHLNRVLPAGFSADPRNHAHWGRCERTAGTNAPPLSFASNFQGVLNHDGMSVTVKFDDLPDHRSYTVTFDGILATRDASDTATIHTAIGTRDGRGRDSDDLGGPAMAQHTLATPPPLPSLPPDPEQASYADAEGLSSYTLAWAGQNNTTYELYRAGERELVAYLQGQSIALVGYNPDDPDNLRAAALKALAPQARQAFQPRSPRLTSATNAYRYRDQLQGNLRTLSVYTVLGRSASGVQSEWPAAASFVVVAVPQAPQPTRPTVLRGVWRPPLEPLPPQAGAARIELAIAEPPSNSAPIVAYEVYRTTDATKTRDYRRMRLMHRLDAPQFDESLNDTTVATYIDPTIRPWQKYFYRVVGRAAAVNGGAVGMRSEASALVEVSTLSAESPVAPNNVTLMRNGATTDVRFEADLPALPFGNYTFTLLLYADQDPATVGQRVLQVTSNTITHTPPDTWMMMVDSAQLPMGAFVSIRVVDAMGNSAESARLLL